MDNFLSHGILSMMVLSLPTLLPILAYQLIHSLIKGFSSLKPRSFVELAYGYLPLVLAGNLAYYLQLLLGEAGKILPITFQNKKSATNKNNHKVNLFNLKS